MQYTGPTYHKTKEEEEALDQEIAELITKKAVEEVAFEVQFGHEVTLT